MTDTKLIPIDDLVRLVTEAGVHHQLEVYETSLSNLVVKDGDPFAELSSAYELASSLGIPDERMAEVIANRYPSREDQLDALEHHTALATTKAVAKTYQKELLHALRRALPASVFRAAVDREARLFDQPHLAAKWRRDYTVKLYLMNEREVSKQVPRSWQNLFGMLGSKTLPETVETKALLATVDIGNEFLSGDSEYGAPGREVPKLYRGKRLHLVVPLRFI